jgi:hypothetical protein
MNYLVILNKTKFQILLKSLKLKIIHLFHKYQLIKMEKNKDYLTDKILILEMDYLQIMLQIHKLVVIVLEMDYLEIMLQIHKLMGIVLEMDYLEIILQMH